MSKILLEKEEQISQLMEEGCIALAFMVKNVLVVMFIFVAVVYILSITVHFSHFPPFKLTLYLLVDKLKTNI